MKMTVFGIMVAARLLRHGVAYGRSDASGDGIAGVLVESARLVALDAVADAEVLQLGANCGHAAPVEVLEADVVGDADGAAELILGVAHERAMDRFRPQRLRAEASAEVLTGARVDAHAEQVEADLDG